MRLGLVENRGLAHWRPSEHVARRLERWLPEAGQMLQELKSLLTFEFGVLVQTLMMSSKLSMLASATFKILNASGPFRRLIAKPGKLAFCIVTGSLFECGHRF